MTSPGAGRGLDKTEYLCSNCGEPALPGNVKPCDCVTMVGYRKNADGRLDHIVFVMPPSPRPSPTDEDVERVARAICKGWGENFDAIHRDKRHWTETHGAGPGGRFRDVNEPRQDGFREMARAAIAAITASPQSDALIKAAQKWREARSGEIDWNRLAAAEHALVIALTPFTLQPEEPQK